MAEKDGRTRPGPNITLIRGRSTGVVAAYGDGQDKTRQDKTQGKTRQGKARQDKARQGKARQHKTRHGIAKKEVPVFI